MGPYHGHSFRFVVEVLFPGNVLRSDIAIVFALGEHASSFLQNLYRKTPLNFS